METIRPEIKTWIAENLIAGCNAEQLVPGLRGMGLDALAAQDALTDAQNHPYIAAAKKVSTDLKKRESVLKTLAFYQTLDPDYLRVERKPLPPYSDFLRDYYYRNRPGLFSGAIDHWPAREWTPRNLIDKVGADSIVEIQIDREKDSDYEINSVKHRQPIRFGDFIEMVERAPSNDFYLTANNLAFDKTPVGVLAKDTGTVGDGYLDTANAAMRMFLWIGPKGTITPLHHDKTNNAFIQVYGRKRIRLIPALEAPFMYNHIGVFSRVDLLNVDPTEFPLFARSHTIDVMVEAGDFLFIPLGWWHHVVGEETSISLSFTNFAAAPNHFVDYPA
ncbi:MAG: cupin-like domain-containing protein [Rickettsiales bacterium]|nr:cupin-like domain-containing protein [Rickettsiales bacterium]